MSLKPIEVLRKGLMVLENRVKTRKDVLKAQLAERKSISSEDEQWLDHDANLVDEYQVLEALEKASDYEQAFARLGDEQKALVTKMYEAADGRTKVVGKKRRRASRIFPILQLELTGDQPNLKAQSTHRLRKSPIRRIIAACLYSPRRRMQHWSSGSKSWIGIMPMGKTSQGQQNTLMRYTQTLK